MPDAEARIAQLETRIGLSEKAVRSYGIPTPSTYDGAPTEAQMLLCGLPAFGPD